MMSCPGGDFSFSRPTVSGAVLRSGPRQMGGRAFLFALP